MDEEERWEMISRLGFKDPSQLHKYIVDGAGKNPGWLISKGLSARKLTALGYDFAGMKKLGYSREHLADLGYASPKFDNAAPTKTPDKTSNLDSNTVRELIAKGFNATELRQRGVTAHHCRVAGFDARDLFRLGYKLDELRGEFNLADLKGVGFNPRELIRLFPGNQIRSAGFTAQEMRCAGFSIRDLLNFGYNENQIITAGYSVNDLIKEGLSRITRDMSNLR